jgi:CheY-like chemotaxis protein
MRDPLFHPSGLPVYDVSIFSLGSLRQQIGSMLCKAEWVSREAETMTTKKEPGAGLILVAEDDADNRVVLRTLLELRGYGVVEAADGHEAVEVARRSRPDLILMDLKMPSLNGLAATRAIRQQPDARLSRTPIVALSAYDPARHRAVAIAAGCNDYLVKPVDYDHLEEVIGTLLAPRPACFDDGARRA